MRLCLVVLASLALSACATPLERVISVAGDVPDWFEDRRSEVRGEGYPSLTAVPNNIDNPLTEAQIRETSAVLDVYEDFLRHPRAQVSTTSPADILAFRDQLEASLPPVSSLKPITPMTDAEIQAIRDVFSPYVITFVDAEG